MSWVLKPSRIPATSSHIQLYPAIICYNSIRAEWVDYNCWDWDFAHAEFSFSAFLSQDSMHCSPQSLRFQVYPHGCWSDEAVAVHWFRLDLLLSDGKWTQSDSWFRTTDLAYQGRVLVTSCIVWKREYQNVKRNRFTRAKVNTKQLTWIYDNLWEYSRTGAPGWLCCRLDRCCRKRRPHSGEESVLGRGRQSFTICRFFRELLKIFEMNFLKYKTNNTYNTNTLSLEEYHRICPSVHHLSLTRLAPVMLSFARVHNWFQRVPSFDRLQTRQDEAVPFLFQVRSVPCTVQYLSRPDGLNTARCLKDTHILVSLSTCSQFISALLLETTAYF